METLLALYRLSYLGSYTKWKWSCINLHRYTRSNQGSATTEEILARERERKARTTLLMALPEDHLAKLHKMTDAKEMWEAIKSRFGGNDESKKMQKTACEYRFEEMDFEMEVAMISMRMKKFYKKTGRKLQFDAKEPVGFDKTKVECYNCHKTGHFARECRTKGNQDSKRRDAWNSGNKDKENGRRSGKQEDSKALVTIDGEGVDWTSHSEEEEDYALMACNTQLSDASIEILAYTQALKKVEAQLVAHQQSQLWYEEKIRFMKIDLDDKTDVLTYHKKLLTEAEKEKEDLKAKITHKYIMVIKLSTSESENQTSDFDTCESNISVETPEFVTEPVVNEPKVVSQPKVWSDAPIIEEYESDSEDEHVSLPTKEQETPSFANKQVKTPRETVKNQFTQKYVESLVNIIRDCDFHEKRMAKQAELNNRMRKKSSQRED
ncbi:ribonuclease H-like domain-containing protein [Tanacetum coccineum]